MTGRRYALVALQASVTGLAFVSLWRSIDRQALVQLLASLPLAFYAISLATILSGQVLYAWRWHVILSASGVDVPFATVVRQYFVGIFVNNFLPGTVGGDVAKVYYLGRDYGYSTITASVVLDRVFGLGVLATMASVTMWLTPAASMQVAGTRVAVTIIAAGAAAALLLVTTGTGGLTRWLRPFGERAVALGARLQRVRLQAAAPITRGRVLGVAVGSVLIYFVGIALIYMWFFRLYSPAAPSFLAVFAASSSATVLSNVPISLNGLGVREQLHAWLLAPLGVAPEVAIALSLLLFSHLLVASAFGWALWLRAPRPPTLAAEDVPA